MTEPGSRIGAYVVLARLGAGGMGEVYLARDTRLERDVALKVLPPALTHDPEQLARFRREALSIASLNHPNIATIFGFEEPADGPTVLVLERVEGESLLQRLARAPLGLEEALQVCAQIAQALEAAHERGVIHRDMKPANVMIGPRGLVKVLDFGLAKRTGGLLAVGGAGPPPGPAAAAPPAPATAPPPADAGPPTFPYGALRAPSPDALHASQEDAPTLGAGPRRDIAGAPAPHADVPPGDMADAPTIASDPRSGAGDAPLTESGMVVGTPGYMSPEQVVAGGQDERTDVFAFGCILYECLAGRRAFGGKDKFATMAAVLTDDVDMTALPARTPARVRTLIERCLEKDADNRLAGIRAARLELEEVLGIRRAAALREGEAYATPNNLPVQATHFVGREDVLRTSGMLLAGTRLLTLTGMGGSGKTRVALRLAEAALESHPDGVWFVDLAPLTEDGRVVEVAAAAVGAREEPGRSTLESLTEQLRGRRVLLVLDNCEDVLRGVASLAVALLRECPEVRLLATSRESLGATGETVFAVPTLALPPAGSAADAGTIAASEAVQLFVARAAAALPGFVLDDAVAPAVAEICRRLDGIPLAIELAAARVKVLGVEQIRLRLDDRFRLLTAGARGAVPRQQTLLATIQWSWDHLTAPEQEQLRLLAVFVGGWTLERATAVVADDADEFEVLDVLTCLVEKSLVVVDRGPSGASSRYRLLESVWRFALEQLEASGQGPAVRARHVALYVALAEESERQLAGPAQAQWIADLDREQGNLLAALAWCPNAEAGGVSAMRLAASVCRYWSARGQYELGRRALAEALRLGGSEPTPMRAKALVRAGGFAMYQTDAAAAQPLIEESLAIYRLLGDRKGIARSLSGLGVVALYHSDAAAAQRIGEESLAIYRELGEARGVGQAIHNLAYIAWTRKDAVTAQARYEEALAEFERLGDEETIALTLAGLGLVQLHLSPPDTAGARRRLRASLDLVRKLGARREGLYAIEAAAELAHAEGASEAAARLLGAAVALREALGSPTFPAEREERADILGRVRERLGEAQFAESSAAGRTLAFEAALAEASDVVERAPADPAV